MGKRTHGGPADPKRVEVGRRNQLKWKGFTPEGLQRLRESALRRKPWQHSTGPRTAEGKRRAAANGKRRQTAVLSRAELRHELAEISQVIDNLAARRSLLGTSDNLQSPNF